MPDGAPNFDALVSQAMASATPQTGDIQGILRQVKGVSAQEAQETSKAIQELTDTAKEDKAEAKRHMAAAEDYEKQIVPWTQQRPDPDPIQGFASLGSVFGILASAFTHQPAVNAMNAAAAGINAMRENDLAKYQDAFTAFKENTAILQKRADQENREFEAARSLMQTDMTLGTAKLNAVVTKYGHQLDALNIQRGLYDDIFTRNDKAFDTATKMGTYVAEMIEGGSLAEAGMKLKNARLSKDPETIAQAQEEYNAALQHYTDFKAQMTGFKPGTMGDPQYIAVKRPDGSGVDQKLAYFDKPNRQFIDVNTGKPIVGEIVGAAKVSTAGGPNAFTPQMGALMGALAERGGSLPVGYRSREQQAQLYQGLIDRNPGKSVDEIADMIKTGQIDLKAVTKETQTAAAQAGRVQVAANELDEFAPLVREASAKVPRGSFMPINRLLQTADNQLSDPNLRALKIRINSLLNAYDLLAARGGTDVNKRAENRALLTSADSPEVLDSALKSFALEAQAAKRAAIKATKIPSESGETANDTPHPQDHEAVQWAREHPDDERAKQILKLNGVQ